MSTGYRIYDQSSCYYLTFQIVDWVDVFSRKRYRDIVMESFTFCREKKALKIWAYVVMTNHVHAILSAENDNLSDVIRDFKSHTSKAILKSIQAEPESRRDWMLKRFEFAANRHKRNSKYQLWTHENHAVQIESEKFMRQKMVYIHNNPVEAGWVEEAKDWYYSSQRNYDELSAPIEIDVMDLGW